MIAILCDDLFSRAKIEEVLNQQGIKYVVISSPDDLQAIHTEQVIVDLTHHFGLELLKVMPENCIAFGPHMRTELFRKARELGCKRVYPRSVFFDTILTTMKE